ncbi:histidinol-phosphate transaminase [Curvibacter sp. CHRR-16]|uniref:histidinol-phosphate transaminase n=1 Tax=Curvibacter sp. CHRR-16 TaxID=2835872 RepID=UPI001BD9F206|nr:histidinol-phosphate transaminase [Curvibacter sp. CHRR-16]MBT0569424.1 histidinol-phosphate transaminase [Curvibacter sp. CHRR-16]
MSTTPTNNLTQRVLERRIRADVRAMHAYHVQDSRGYVKLDAMENPFCLPADLQAALGQRLGQAALHRYPDNRVEALRQALQQYTDMPADYRLILGNGSDELISLVTMACQQGTDPTTGRKPVVLAPVPGFVMYAMSAALLGLDFCGVPLLPSFALDVPAMEAAIAEQQPAIVYLAYPNNPTGTLWDKADMRRVIAAAAAVGSIVVLDEAYQPFSSHTWLDEMRADPVAHGHVLLMRTLSKFGLAGVRLGYLMGPAALVAEIDKVRPPYNVSVLNYECAIFALEHQAVFAAQAQQICAERAMLLGALQAMPIVTVFESQANMILLRSERTEAAVVFQRLKERGILIKNVSTMHPLLANCLRLTVGTPDENRQLLAALQESL